MTNVSRTPGTAAIRQIRAISLKTDASRSWALYWVRSHCPADLSAVEDYIGQRDEMQCHAVLKSTAIVIQLVIQRTRGCFFANVCLPQKSLLTYLRQPDLSLWGFQIFAYKHICLRSETATPVTIALTYLLLHRTESFQYLWAFTVVAKDWQ